MPVHDLDFWSARQDFRRARQQASLQEVLGRLRGKSQDLLSYDEVRQKLHTVGTEIHRGTQDIPLNSIVGSVGRYADFTRSFLPLNPSDEQRWAHVMALVTEPGGPGLAPIDVIKLGDVYFVKDGHHRVSVARQLGAKTIQAHVTEITSKIPLSTDADLDDLILKEEYASFLEKTRLDRSHPGVDLTLTVPGQYASLLEHIQVHQYFMGEEEKRDVSLEEAADHWYEHVYLPVVEAIRERGILRDFPDRTETDLYLWVSEHRTELQQELGEFITSASAASHFAEQYGTRAGRVAARIGRSLTDAMVPPPLEDGPPTGTWREEKEQHEQECLFESLLVPISGEVNSWLALEQALIISRREGSRIHGLHIVREEADEDSDAVRAVREEFNRRCGEANMACGLAVEAGDIARTICARALLSDLVVVYLAHPPSAQPLARLGSGFRTLIRQCARPILAVPCEPTALDRGLLAYDGSPKSREAMYLAAYLAGRWNIPITVSVVDGRNPQSAGLLDEADAYFQEHEIVPEKMLRDGPVSDAILGAAQDSKSQFILMGGYGSSPVVEVVLGSNVDAVLRESAIPVFVCR